MRHTYGASLSPDGTAIAYIVRDGGYPRAVEVPLENGAVGDERPVELPVEGPVTRVLHSPDAQWIACEVSPGGTERLETWLVPAGSNTNEARHPQLSGDAKNTLVEWDGNQLAMDAFTADGIAEGRLVDPRTGDHVVLDRRTDSQLVAAESGHALMRVGPRGSRELLLVRPDGSWLPLLPPEPGAMTESGVILGSAAMPDFDTQVVLALSDHGSDRRRVLRLEIEGDDVEISELIAMADSDVDEFVISENLTTAAVLWNTGGVSALDVLSLGENQQVLVRRSIELPGMVATDLSITDDGELLSLTVEGPNLPPTVEILSTATGKIESLDVERSRRITERAQADYMPELVRYMARDGLELSGWLYHSAVNGLGKDIDANEGPGPVYIHVHGGPELQSRPVNHDILTALIDSGVTVFTPNIRGSSGAGRAFIHADDRYGRFAAIRDLADTAKFLIAAGIADPDRIALGGRSYGGFLSLLAAERFPRLFRAIIDACGMTSWETYYASTEPWLAAAAAPKYGYPLQDAELLHDISPITNAHRITEPVLFIHGDTDTNVPPAESQQMVDALTARGMPVEHLVVPGEGHKFAKPKSRRLIAATMLDFLQRHGVVDTPNLTNFDARIEDMRRGRRRFSGETADEHA
ncbi:prolyl oligopeptidase family serine peptidase [Corynebacterium sp. TAE3-ERU12]|uniref:alpha/beta hydrolase family protein n=1 Tax=Corynebacterium sp. TAE3-ERU12 TaxID=2849491 RepID=UPI001C485922|nr:prolyl oligopeptidase family serine peptidase [Corynebacterium sp. TAE3-ERU12]MBV7294743.1 prolyl oligopeptidase family serine peptidase [Corynebacterium sp. TAE3-ERU12]